MNKIKIIIIGMFLIVLTGCTKFDFTLDVNKKGDTSFVFVGEINENLVALSEVVKIDLDKMGENFDTFERSKQQNKVVFTGKKELGNVLRLLLVDMENNIKVNGIDVKVKKGLVINTYEVTVNTKHLISSYISEEEQALLQLIGNNIPLEFHLDLPLSLYDSNASNVEKNNGSYKYSWEINLRKEEEIKASLRFINVRNVIVGLIIGLVSILIIGKILRKKK